MPIDVAETIAPRRLRVYLRHFGLLHSTKVDIDQREIRSNDCPFVRQTPHALSYQLVNLPPVGVYVTYRHCQNAATIR